MRLKEVVKLAIENDGCTLNVNDGTVNPSKGFLASYEGYSEVVKLSQFNEAKLKEYIRLNLVALTSNAEYLGIWINKGLVYLDVSKRFVFESSCVEFSRANSQKAYYNANTKTVVNLT